MDAMILLQLWICRDVVLGKLGRVKADAVLIDGIMVDDDAVQKSRAHFMLVVLRSSERMQRKRLAASSYIRFSS